MPQFRSQALLDKSTVAVTVGNRPNAARSALKNVAAATLLFAATALSAQAKEPNALEAAWAKQQRENPTQAAQAQRDAQAVNAKTGATAQVQAPAAEQSDSPNMLKAALAKLHRRAEPKAEEVAPLQATGKQVGTTAIKPILGEVVSVSHVRGGVEQPAQNKGGRFGDRMRSLTGAVIGGVVGHQFGGGDGKTLMTAVGAVTGGSIANRLNQRRAQQGENGGFANAQQVQDNNLVVVRVPTGASFETYQIVQSAGIDLKKGDQVALSSPDNGKTILALPTEEPEAKNVQRSRPRHR